MAINYTFKMAATGTLVVRPLTAALSNDGELFGKADPYVVVQVGNQKQQTQVHKDGGKNPRWNDSLQFSLNNDQVMVFWIMDRDHMSAGDCIGEGQVNLMDIVQRRSVNQSYPVLRKGKPNGTINLAVDFTPGPAQQWGAPTQPGWGQPNQGWQQGPQGGQGQYGHPQGGFGGPGQQGGFGHR